MRKATVAGSFYSSDAAELKQDIHELFLGKFGPGKLADIKKERQEKKLYGVIVPHAGYIYSGQATAHAYKAIAESKNVDTFILLGTDHTGYGESNFALSSQDFETPLGVMKNDKEFFDSVILEFKENKGKGFSVGNTVRDEKAHESEHSIEVQLPFLQSVVSKFKILPVIAALQIPENYIGFARLIVDVSKNLKRKICVIASSDFTHYGSMYGFMPFSSHVKENIYAIDKKAISKILKFDTASFLDSARNTTICGAGAIAACIEICKQLGSKKTELLKYYTSGDIILHYDSAVGYATIAFR